MNDSSVSASRYANALCDIYEQKNQLDTLYSDMSFVAEAFSGNPDLPKFCANPTLPPEDKINFFKNVFSEKISDDALKGIIFIIEERRAEIISDVAVRCLEIINEKLNRQIAEVHTCYPLTPEQENTISKSLSKETNKQIIIKTVIDPSVIGGFRAYVGTRLYDLSVDFQLKQIKRELLK